MPLRAAHVWAEARSEVRHAGKVPGEGKADKTIPSSCSSALESGNSLHYPEH